VTTSQLPFKGTASFGWSMAALAVLATGIPARAGDSVANADTSKKKIAFSNSFAGNSFRQAMIKSFLDIGPGEKGSLNRGCFSRQRQQFSDRAQRLSGGLRSG
jgi:hypothetical protein